MPKHASALTDSSGSDSDSRLIHRGITPGTPPVVPVPGDSITRPGGYEDVERDFEARTNAQYEFARDHQERQRSHRYDSGTNGYSSNNFEKARSPSLEPRANERYDRSARRQRRRPESYDYHRPRGEDGRSLVIDVSMYGLGRSQAARVDSFASWKWPAPTDPSSYDGQTQFLLHISRAKRWFDTEREHLVDLTCDKTNSKDDSVSSDHIRWL